MVKNLPASSRHRTHRIDEPGGLQPMGSQRVRHNQTTTLLSIISLSFIKYIFLILITRRKGYYEEVVSICKIPALGSVPENQHIFSQFKEIFILFPCMLSIPFLWMMENCSLVILILTPVFPSPSQTCSQVLSLSS